MQWYRRWVEPYILLMAATVAIAALFPAQGRGASVADAGIIFLFFLYRVRLSTSAAFRGIFTGASISRSATPAPASRINESATGGLQFYPHQCAIEHLRRRRRNLGYATEIGEEVLVGHMAMTHGSTLMAGSFVGIAGITMDGTVIEPGGMLAAGAMLTPHKRIGSNELWAGRPAMLLRALTEFDLGRSESGVAHHEQLAREYRLAVS